MTKPKPWVSKDGVWTNAAPDSLRSRMYGYACYHGDSIVADLSRPRSWDSDMEIRTVLPISPPPLPEDLPWGKK